MCRKIKWFSILSLAVIVFAMGCGGNKNLSPEGFQTVNVDIAPPSSLTISPLSPSAICFGGNDDKVYIYSKSNRLLYEMFLEIYSALTPDEFKTTYAAKEFPSKEYQHQLDDFAVLLDGKIVAYSKEARELVLFSKKGELISRIKENFKDGVLLAPCNYDNYEDDHFFLVDKGKRRMYIMNTSGKILLDLGSETNIGSSQIEEILHRDGYLYARTSTNQIVKYNIIYHSTKENPEEYKYSIFESTTLLDEFPSGQLLGFTVDVLGDLFIAYHSEKEGKLKIAMVVSDGKKRELKIFHERPMSEVPRFFKILAYRGFLMVVEGDDSLRISTYPIRQIK